MKRQSNKRLAVGAAAMVAIGLLASAMPAYAQTTNPTYPMKTANIVWQGKQFSHPDAFAYKGTTYMPIWYVSQLLNQVGVQTSWDGHTWSLTAPATLAPDMTKLSPGKGTMVVTLNGQDVENVTGLVAKDPSSKTDTTFMPIWYIIQVLERMGVTSSWNGSTWSLKQTRNISLVPGTTKAGFLQDFMLTLGIPANWSVVQQPSTAKSSSSSSTSKSTGASTPYDDVAATDDAWAYVNAALADGFMSADSSTHFGSSDAVTLSMVDNMYWTRLNMGHVAYEPGQSVTGWGQAIGLNPAGVDVTTPLTNTQVTQVLSNLVALTKGYAQTSDGNSVGNGSNTPTSGSIDTGNAVWQIYYPPADEYNQTFSGLSVDGKPIYSQATAASAINEVYQFFNSITVTEAGENLVVSMPSTVNTPWFAYAGTTGQLEYNLFNGDGASWQTAPTFDGRNIVAADLPANVTQVLLRVPKASGLILSLNEQLPSLGGSVTLGEIQISYNSDGLQVQRMSFN